MSRKRTPTMRSAPRSDPRSTVQRAKRNDGWGRLHGRCILLTAAIHRAARHALNGDPYAAEKVAKAIEVEERLRVASWHGRRANRAPQERETTTEGVENGN